MPETERLPGQVIGRTQLDVAGALTGVSVHGSVGGTADRSWFGWTSRSNALGQVVNEATTAVGAGFAPSVPIPSSELTYGYDRAGRLTSVNDVRDGECTVRLYEFDDHGNRKSQTTRAPGGGGACATSGGGATIQRAFDAADRPTTGGNAVGSYTYDQLGRSANRPACRRGEKRRSSLQDLVRPTQPRVLLTEPDQLGIITLGHRRGHALAKIATDPVPQRRLVDTQQLTDLTTRGKLGGITLGHTVGIHPHRTGLRLCVVLLLSGHDPILSLLNQTLQQTQAGSDHPGRHQTALTRWRARR